MSETVQVQINKLCNTSHFARQGVQTLLYGATKITEYSATLLKNIVLGSLHSTCHSTWSIGCRGLNIGYDARHKNIMLPERSMVTVDHVKELNVGKRVGGISLGLAVYVAMFSGPMSSMISSAMMLVGIAPIVGKLYQFFQYNFIGSHDLTDSHNLIGPTLKERGYLTCTHMGSCSYAMLKAALACCTHELLADSKPFKHSINVLNQWVFPRFVAAFGRPKLNVCNILGRLLGVYNSNRLSFGDEFACYFRREGWKKSGDGFDPKKGVYPAYVRASMSTDCLDFVCSLEGMESQRSFLQKFIKAVPIPNNGLCCVREGKEGEFTICEMKATIKKESILKANQVAERVNQYASVIVIGKEGVSVYTR